PTLDEAIKVIQAGNREQGRQMLEEILETDENNEEVWLWLSSAVDSDEDREVCLENVLALNPDNVVAQKGLEALRSGTFNVNDLVDEVSDDFDDGDDDSENTFLDDFMMDDDEDEDDEIEWPSGMGGSSPAKTETKKSGGLNVRMLILGALAVLVVLALAGVAAVNLLGGGGDTADPVDPAQEQPAQEAPAEEAEATDTPVPTETPAPTPTDTPFVLPTALPTDAPTPTATPVVSPTPE
ncbi:MAG: hypothetical protein AAF485_13350, partial [Chloroflexota bacterium]